MRLKTIDFLYVTFILTTVFAYFNYYPLNVDSTWILNSAHNILAGSTLYKDIIDVNPPLIFMYACIPTFVAELISVSRIYIYIIFVIFVISVSAYLCFIILLQYYKKQEDTIRYFLYSIIFILTISVNYDFGQREHLFMIFVFPYILSLMYKDSITLSKNILITIAIFASLGFNIKPHFFLIFIGIELIYMIHKKDILSIFRIDSIIISLSGFFYLIIIFVFFNEYINNTVPFAMATYSDVFNKSYLSLIMTFEIFLTLFIMIFWSIFTKKKIDLTIKVIFISLIMSITIYLIQQKGWNYHKIPILCISLLFLTHLIFSLLKKDKSYSLALFPLIFYIIYFNLQTVPKFKELENIIHRLPFDQKIYIISTDIAQGQPLLKENQIWTSRFPSLFMLPALLKNEKIESMQYTFDSLYEDFVNYKPDSIIFPRKEIGFDYYNYFTSKDVRLNKFYENYYTMSIISNYIILSKNKEYK